MNNQECDPDKGCWLLSTCESDQISYSCVHDPILELTPYTGFVYFLIPILLGTSIMGGLGSGMIKRPILNLLLNYPSSISTQVADCFLFTTSTLNSLFLFFEKHPDHHNLPLINFDISIILNQTIPLAWSAGAFLQQRSPKFIIYLIQLCFLLGAIPFLWKFTHLQKRLEQDKKENIILVNQKIKTQEDMANETNFDEKLLNQYQQFYKNDHKKFQIKNLSFIFGSFFVNQTIILMRSNKYNNSIIGLDKCTLENNLILLAIIGINLTYTFFVYWSKRNEEYYKDIVQYRPNQRFFKEKKQFFFYYLGGFLAGFSTGLLGMGGGLIMVTFLLSQKIIAREAAATAAFGSFMISLNSLIQFILQKTITDEQMLVFFILGILGVIIIAKPSYIFMNRFKIGYIILIVDIIQVSINVFSIFALIIINTILYGFDAMLNYYSHC
ncbi:unnamed protein product [Paramecium primaurelia]|uniref:Sulfite exporter TauE/SafE n=1 Tax=Paramecium primaurelia TaxID=5886 RepID=A0A8S1PYB6_PARPR|nr:unnamed protein product [Paramecium primaurelia]